MLRDWLQIPALKRVLQNFMVLASGRAAGGVLGFIATLLSARALGPEDFGVVAMISAYVLVVRGFCNIKPFEAIVRYGVALADDHDLEGLARLLRVSLALDAVSALSGTMIAVLVAWLGGPLMGWSSSTTTVAMGYSLILLGSGTATASGSLRIFDRFDAISHVQVFSSVWRLAGVVLVTQLGAASVSTIAAVWATAQFTQYLGTSWYGARVVFARMSWRRLRGPLDLGEMGRSHPGIWSFLNVIYWQATLDLVPKSLGTLYAGALLGPHGAAMFRIAREFANVVAKPALLVRQAIYPDLARLRHRRDDAFNKVVVSMAAMMGIPALLLAVASLWLGAPLLKLAVGENYVPAAGLLTWLIAAATLEMAASPLRPAGYALGCAKAMLAVQVVASVVFIAAFQGLTPALGVTGPGVATVAMSLVTLLGMAFAVRRALTPAA
ncbi:MAG: lipopolysaccharide biosynthesis protein [Proteobacteria bacterium]|nr:lipopolysaccharide biosynthesis protein [Pseudomonadota bacterium]